MLKLWDKKDELNRKRSVVDNSAVPDLASGDSRAQIQSLRDSAMGNILFVIDADGSPALLSIIGDKITSLGFKTLTAVPLQPDKSKTVISLKCSISASPLDRGNPSWKFSSWRANADMAEMWAEQGGSFATVSEHGESFRVKRRCRKKQGDN